MKAFKLKGRYWVLAILSSIWLLSFIDRMVISTAIPYIGKDFHLSPLQMGMVMSAFFGAYSVCQIPGGMLGDKFGARRVLAFAVFCWSLFTAFTGMAATFIQMIVTRVLFGFGEGIFPGCSYKAIATWFPTRERATALAVCYTCSSLGRALAPLIAVGIMSLVGWRPIFYVLFIPGVLVLWLTLKYVKDRPGESSLLTKDELAEITEGEPPSSTAARSQSSIWAGLKIWKVWQLTLILFAYDITYWGFSTWLPSYLVKVRHFDMMKMGVLASLPYFAGIIGGYLGGRTSDKYFSHNRKIPAIASQLLGVTFLYFLYTTKSDNWLIVILTIAGFTLVYANTSFWSLPMSTISKEVMGVAGGLVNTGGQLAAFISPMAFGYIVQISGGSFDYAFVFLIAASLVSCALILTIQRIKEDEGTQSTAATVSRR